MCGPGLTPPKQPSITGSLSGPYLQRKEKLTMSDFLFDDEQLFTGDPLNPDLKQVCPPSVISELNPSERIDRVGKLVDQANEIVDMAWEKESGGRMRAAWCVLFSGGNDSTVLAHMMRGRVDHAVHANTTIGVEETRQFVRDTCKNWNLNLIERVAPIFYRELVIDRGFPGPAMHYKVVAP